MRDRSFLINGIGDELQAVVDGAQAAGLAVKDPGVQAALIELYGTIKQNEWIEEGVRALEYIKDELRRDRRGSR